LLGSVHDGRAHHAAIENAEALQWICTTRDVSAEHVASHDELPRPHNA
jgi:hypothetical protein